jgi:hypothetical protein
MLAAKARSTDSFSGLRRTAEHEKIFAKQEPRLIATIEQSRRAAVKSGQKDPAAIVDLLLKDEQLGTLFDEVMSESTLAGLSRTPAHQWLGSLVAKLVLTPPST